MKLHGLLLIQLLLVWDPNHHRALNNCEVSVLDYQYELNESCLKRTFLYFYSSKFKLSSDCMMNIACILDH